MFQKLLRLLRGNRTTPSQPRTFSSSLETIQIATKTIEETFTRLQSEFTENETLEISLTALPQKNPPKPRTLPKTKTASPKTSAKPVAKKAPRATQAPTAKSVAQKAPLAKNSNASKQGKTEVERSKAAKPRPIKTANPKPAAAKKSATNN